MLSGVVVCCGVDKGPQRGIIVLDRVTRDPAVTTPQAELALVPPPCRNPPVSFLVMA